MTLEDHEAKFLAALRKRAPGDAGDELRRVYADWLVEQGDPRGEFIQVQCDLAQLAEDSEVRERLQERERELLKKYQASWVPAPCLRRVDWDAHLRFSRGFLSGMALCSTSLLADGQAILPKLAPLISLAVLDCPTDWEAYRAGRQEPASYIGRQVAELSALELLSHLERLLIEVLDFDATELGRMVECTRPPLRTLGIRAVAPARRGNLGPKDVERLLGWADQLTELELLGQPIGDAGATALARARLPLRKLELLHCRIGDAGLAELLAAYDLAETSLELRGAQLSAEGVRLLASHVSRHAKDGLWVVTSEGQIAHQDRNRSWVGGENAPISFTVRRLPTLSFQFEDGQWFAVANGPGVRLNGRLRVSRQPVQDGDEFSLGPGAFLRCILRSKAEGEWADE